VTRVHGNAASGGTLPSTAPQTCRLTRGGQAARPQQLGFGTMRLDGRAASPAETETCETAHSKLSGLANAARSKDYGAAITVRAAQAPARTVRYGLSSERLAGGEFNYKRWKNTAANLGYCGSL